MRKSYNDLRIIKVILVIIIIFYLIFLYIDIFNSKLYSISKYIKFLCIILCLIISLLSNNNPINLKDIKLLQIGLFLTVIADLFLLVIDNYYEIGVGIFAIAQITYSIRYTDGKSRQIIINYAYVMAALTLIYFIVYSTKGVPILFPLALFYGMCLITNVILSIRLYRGKLYPYPNGAMIAVGMVLFLLCDINVALYNILKTNGLLHSISSISMWLFYLPSQVLLALSGYDFNKRGN